MLCRSNSSCNNTDIYLFKESYVLSFLEKKLLDKAIEEGHIAKAKLRKEHDTNNYTEFGVYSTGKKMATYEYNYNGKTY